MTEPTIDELKDWEALIAKRLEEQMHIIGDQKARLAAIECIEQIVALDDNLLRRRRAYGLVGLARDFVEVSSAHEGIAMLGAAIRFLDTIDVIMVKETDIEHIGAALRAACLARWDYFAGPYIEQCLIAVQDPVSMLSFAEPEAVAAE